MLLCGFYEYFRMSFLRGGSASRRRIFGGKVCVDTQQATGFFFARARSYACLPVQPAKLALPSDLDHNRSHTHEV